MTNFLFEKTVKNLNGVIVLGESLKYLFSDYFPPNKIFVAPNGGDYVFPKKTDSNQVFRILFISRLFKSKGIEDVIDAAIQLNNPNCEFILAGGWSSDSRFKEKLLQKIEHSQINLKILPPVSGQSKFKLYADADIFVFPPILPEGHPWVTVESIAAGLPVISTNQGAITDCVIDGKNGFIVEPNRPDLIAEKIKFLLDNPSILKKMGMESRKHYEANFTAKNLVENFANVFNSVIKGF